MKVPEDDPRISTRQCIPFFRSAAVCGSGHTSSLLNTITPREQINSINAFVDGSAVYGNSDKQNKGLRNFTTDQGFMKVNQRFTDAGRSYLPFNNRNPCVQDRFDTSGETIPCFLAGDGRASEHQTLAIIHTLWLREHNRIARGLKEVNPHWTGEIVYQEARKIVGAYHQVVNWKEYLPKIIGAEGVQLMGNYTGFKDDVNPSISNVFATAVFRFGHVTIHPEFRRLDENFDDHPQFPTILLHEAFFASWRIIREGGADPIVRGLIGRPAKLSRPDELMHEELREKLFALQNQVALDLASLNLQRGRDHGLPGYNDWRVECGMSFAENFSMLRDEIRNDDVRNKLEELYGHPSNIDVWLGGLAEDLIDGARVGPTFRCLIARQFQFLRDGDQYFYKSQFTSQQLENLEALTFARVICENTGLDRVQADVFRTGVFPDNFRSCDQIPQIDFERWRENPEVGDCGVPPTVENGKSKKCGNAVSYYCDESFSLEGASELMCENGRFTPAAPRCVDMNECVIRDNGGCSHVCENTRGSYICSCPDGFVLSREDRRTCEEVTDTRPVVQEVFTDEDGQANVAAIAVGTLFAITLVVAVSAMTVIVYKYVKLRKLSENPMSKFTFPDKKQPEFDNPTFNSQ